MKVGCKKTTKEYKMADSIMREKDDDIFLLLMEERAKGNGGLYSQTVVARIHRLAETKPVKDLERDYYRMPTDYLLSLIVEAKAYRAACKHAEEFGCSVTFQKDGLTLLRTC